MLAILGWTLAGLLVALLCLLFLPIGLRLSARTAPSARLRIDVRFLSGLTPWLPLVDTDRPGRAKRRRTPKEKSKGALGHLPSGRMLRAGTDLLPGLLRVFRVRRLYVEGRYGLGDPASTGMVQGYLSALAPILRTVAPEPVTFAIEPDFDRAGLDGVAEAEVGMRLARAVPPALRFAWAVYGPIR